MRTIEEGADDSAPVLPEDVEDPRSRLKNPEPPPVPEVDVDGALPETGEGVGETRTSRDCDALRCDSPVLLTRLCRLELDSFAFVVVGKGGRSLCNAIQRSKASSVFSRTASSVMDGSASASLLCSSVGPLDVCVAFLDLGGAGGLRFLVGFFESSPAASSDCCRSASRWAAKDASSSSSEISAAWVSSSSGLSPTAADGVPIVGAVGASSCTVTSGTA